MMTERRGTTTSTPGLDLRLLRRARRGSVVVIAIWAVAVTTILAASIQLFAYRQSMVSYDSLDRMRARWAARSGVEASIAMMALHTTEPVPDDARAILIDLEQVSAGELLYASFDIQHHRDGFNINGPRDAHSRLNVGREGFPLFELLEDISFDQAAAIQDWIDEDDEPGLGGAEVDYYRATSGIQPRNGPLHSIAELELIAGVWNEYVRNEDQNLNGRLDPNENDGDLTPPNDLADDVLDMGWSGLLTVYSVDFGATDSGLPRVHLRRAEDGELEDRCGVSTEQAEILIAFGRHEDNSLLDLITTPISQINTDGTVANAPVNEELEDLTDDQLIALLTETRVLPLFDRRPGRVNVNTASQYLIEDMCEARGLPIEIAEEIIYLRSSQPQGIVSELEFRDMRGVDEEILPVLLDMFGTRTNVFVIASRGRAGENGPESEIIAVVDRSTVPVRILEYREQ